MENYDELKALIKLASPDIIEPMRSCPQCDGAIRYDKERNLFFCTHCPHQYEEPIPELGIIQLMNVLHTLWMADAHNYYVDINREFRTWKDSMPTGIFWHKADDNLDHQSDEVKQFLIDYFSIQENVDSLMKRVELRRWNDAVISSFTQEQDARVLPILQPALREPEEDSLE
jgi:hypothetical protein